MNEQNLQQQAENLFLNTDKSQKEIAEQIGIDPKTLYRWIRQGHWRELKSATRRMPSILVENIYAQLDDINFSIAQRDRGNRFPTKDESLTINRLINSVEKVKKQTSQGQNIEFMMNFINWLMPQNRELADTLLNYSSGFLKGTEVNGFHPYDIEFENEEINDDESDPLASLRGTKQSRQDMELAPSAQQQPELPFPQNQSVQAPEISQIAPVSQSPSGEVGHESGIEQITPDQSHPVDNQPQTPANTEAPMPEMPENFFPENRACETTGFPSLRGTACPDGLSGKQSRQNVSLLAQDSESTTEQHPNESPKRKKKKRPEPEYPINPKLIYPGSGVHYLRKKKGHTRPLSKEDYDNLFRPDENKPKPRNEKW